jgi:hypothetical protein
MKNSFISTREGLIAFSASIIYFLVWGLSRIFPDKTPIQDFYSFFCGLMPFLIAMFYAKMGGFNKSFKSSYFNTVIIVFVCLAPFIGWVMAVAKSNF